MTGGILLVDKPGGITSHDVVARVRRALGTRKAGHAGTLDPMATGLLLLGVGSSTRVLTYLVGLDKTYLATIRLGVATTTDDAEGEPTAVADASTLDRAAVEAAIASLRGRIRQVPSTFSAIKVGGRRAYALARDGADVSLAAREVTVSAFDVLAERRTRADVSADASGQAPAVLDLDVRVSVSSGTYVRSLARDLGAALGVGGHLTALRRTRVGPFDVADALPVPDPAQPGVKEHVERALREPGEILERIYPAVELDAAALVDLVHGRRIHLDHEDAAVAAALTPGRRLAGIIAIERGAVRVLTGFPASEVLP